MIPDVAMWIGIGCSAAAAIVYAFRPRGVVAMLVALAIVGGAGAVVALTSERRRALTPPTGIPLGPSPGSGAASSRDLPVDGANRYPRPGSMR